MSPRARTVGQLLAAAVVAGGVVVAFLSVPVLRESLTVLAHLQYGWLLLALGEQAASMAAFAKSTRRLLEVGGRLLPLRVAMAVTYASNALATSVPIAGPGLGTAYSYRLLRRHGVDAAVVSWALTLSGVVSSLAFALVMLVGVLVSDSAGASLFGVVGVTVTALPLLAVLAALRFESVRSAVNHFVGWLVRWSRRLFHRPAEGAAGAFEALLQRIAGLNATRRQYVLAFGSSLRNWLTDCLCLAFSILATGAHVPWRGLLLSYCLAKTAGGLGVTPGGAGVVEIALATLLTHAGMPAAKALPAALLYRLVSFWLVAAVGWMFLAALRRIGGRTPQNVEDSAEPGPGESP